MAEKFTTDVPAELFENRPTYSDFVQFGDNMEYLTNYLREKKYYRCIASAVENPGHFYVTMANNSGDFKRLMDRMQMLYSVDQKRCPVPSPDTLRVGLYVASHRKFDNQWNRAVITRKINDFDYEVFNVDYGDHQNVSIRLIRYLTKEMFYEMKAQAVLCKMKLGIHYTADLARRNGWNRSHGIKLQSYFELKSLAVKFVEQTVVDDVSTWHVFVHILASDRSCKVIDLHIERKLYVECFGRFLPITGDKMDTCESVHLVTKLDLDTATRRPYI